MILDSLDADYDFLVQAPENYPPNATFAEQLDEDADMRFSGDDGNGPN